MSQALHHHYLTQHLSNTFADGFADSQKPSYGAKTAKWQINRMLLQVHFCREM